VIDFRAAGRILFSTGGAAGTGSSIRRGYAGVPGPLAHKPCLACSVVIAGV
jgi:hypothetical protein